MRKKTAVIRTAADAVALIREEKARQGLRWDQIAARAQVATSTLGNWVYGIRMPHLETALMVLHSLGLEITVRRTGGG